jgi:hypothetical protein
MQYQPLGRSMRMNGMEQLIEIATTSEKEFDSERY